MSVRDQYQTHIRNIVRTIDKHSRAYHETQNEFHLQQYELLVEYIHRLKSWIKSRERDSIEDKTPADTE